MILSIDIEVSSMGSILVQNINQLNATIQNINQLNQQNIDQLRDEFNQMLQNICQINQQNTYQLNQTMQIMQESMASNELTISALQKAIKDTVGLFETKG